MVAVNELALKDGGCVPCDESLRKRIGNAKVPRILIEEHVFAWCGRIHRINDVRKPVLPTSSYSTFLPFKLTGLAELAALAGMDIERLLRRHSMIPFVRAVLPDSSSIGSDGRRNVSSEITPRLAARWGSLRYCPGCAARDKRRLGFSYWRRIHQLPGVLWCPWHKTALIATSDRTTYAEEPGDHLSGVDASQGLWSSYSAVPPAVIAYMHLATRTLLRPHPVSSSSMTIRLIAMAHAFQAMDGDSTGMKRRLNGLVEEAFTTQWLAKVAPQRIGVGRGEASADWMSLLYYWPKPRATERYLIVAAALRADANWVGNTLFAPEYEYWVPDVDHGDRSTPSRQWLISAGRRLAATIKDAAAVDPIASTPSRLREALVRFMNGCSLEESCARSQADPMSFQSLLRERLLHDDETLVRVLVPNKRS